MFGKIIKSAMDFVVPNSIEDLVFGPVLGNVAEQLFGRDGADQDRRGVDTCDHRRSREGGTMVEGYNLENVDSVKQLLRDAAGGDETAKKVLAENSQLIDLTLQSFAQQERAFSNLSQAFFDIDKALIQNIRV